MAQHHIIDLQVEVISMDNRICLNTTIRIQHHHQMKWSSHLIHRKIWHFKCNLDSKKRVSTSFPHKIEINNNNMLLGKIMGKWDNLRMYRCKAFHWVNTVLFLLLVNHRRHGLLTHSRGVQLCCPTFQMLEIRKILDKKHFNLLWVGILLLNREIDIKED